MKKIFLLFVFLFIKNIVFSQCDLNPLACDELNQESYGSAEHITIATDMNDITYIAFSDGMNGNKITVRKYNGTSWEAVGMPGFSSGTVTNITLVFDNLNTPYVSFVSIGYSSSVMKFDGVNWTYVGNPNFTPLNSGASSDFAIDFLGVPYIVFIDSQVGGRASVMKFNGTSWVYVGTQGFSSNAVVCPSIAIDAAGTPYVVYGDNNYTNKASVMKFNGTSWVSVGSPGFSNLSIDYSLNSAIIEIDQSSGIPYVIANKDVLKFNGTSWVIIGNSIIDGHRSMDIDQNGMLYIAHKSVNYNGSLIKYNGTNWTNIGSAAINTSISTTAYFALSLNAAGIPFVAFNQNNKAVVKTLFNNMWVSLQEGGITNLGANKTSIVIDKNGTPFILYSDFGLDGRHTVKKFDGTAWVSVGNEGFSTADSYYTSLALDTNNLPYVFYRENINGGPVVVKNFNGNSWVNVGNLGYTLNSDEDFTILINPITNKPHIVYSSGYNGYKAMLGAFDGVNWNSLGLSPEYADYLSAAISDSGEVYIAYNSPVLSPAGISIMKFNGTSFVNVGSRILIGSDKISMAIDKNGTPYIAFNHAISKISVMKYDGSSWIYVGPSQFGPSGVNDIEKISLAIDPNGIPYVSFIAVVSGYLKPIVMKNIGTSWVTVGSPWFSIGNAIDADIAIDNSGIAHVVYSTGDVFVRKYDLSTVLNYNGSLCQGSNINLSATGGTSYSWSGPNNFTSSLSNTIIPNASSAYSGNYNVTISTSSCSVTKSFIINVDSTCQDVWPGDANSDGIADNLDVLELGLHYTQTGAPRASTSNTWQSYFANNWIGTISNGKNLNHSDCNGDGTINDNDTLAIYNNYGLTHAFKPAQTSTVNPQLSIVPDQTYVTKGNWGTASVYLGDATNPITNINGLAFTVDFDNTLIETNSIYIEYQNSFLDAGQNLHFRKLDFVNGKIFTATTHTLNNNVSGNGLIAKLHYQIKSSLTTDEVLNIGLSQANQSNASGTIVPLTSDTATLMAIGASVGVQELNGNVISVSPNPSNGSLTIQSKTELQKIEVMSVDGKILLSEIPTNISHTLHLDNFANGIYFINLYQNNRVVMREKVILNK